MSRYFNVNGTWHQGGHAWVNINGTWPVIGNMWVNINGVWHALFSYYWSVGGWGGCSATCGGGVQYRDVVCMRNDGWNGGWEGYCTTYVGAKPATSQACNTHSCVSCGYSGPTCYNCGGTSCSYCWREVENSSLGYTETTCPGPYTCTGYIKGAYRAGAEQDFLQSGDYHYFYRFYELCR